MVFENLGGYVLQSFITIAMRRNAKRMTNKQKWNPVSLFQSHDLPRERMVIVKISTFV